VLGLAKNPFWPEKGFRPDPSHTTGCSLQRFSRFRSTGHRRADGQKKNAGFVLGSAISRLQILDGDGNTARFLKNQVFVWSPRSGRAGEPQKRGGKWHYGKKNEKFPGGFRSAFRSNFFRRSRAPRYSSSKDRLHPFLIYKQFFKGWRLAVERGRWFRNRDNDSVSLRPSIWGAKRAEDQSLMDPATAMGPHRKQGSGATTKGIIPRTMGGTVSFEGAIISPGSESGKGTAFTPLQRRGLRACSTSAGKNSEGRSAGWGTISEPKGGVGK